jgi:hypothetical protein
MALTTDEERQLELLDATLSEDDPQLASRLRRMSAYSGDTAGMLVGSVGVFLVGGGIFAGMGLALGRPDCLLAGGVCVGAAVLTATGAWLARLRYRRGA